jgi:hypothetical protein
LKGFRLGLCSSRKRIENFYLQRLFISSNSATYLTRLMAYYYAILHLMREYASSTYFPIVIDSPNQQGQDAENLPILLNFILNKQPKDSQLVLSIEEEHGIDFNGKLIYLTNKQSVLSEDGYD